MLCSQLSGKKFCDCVNWKGVCIYQEYVWNGNKAKKGRANYLCDIVNKEILEEKLMIFTIHASHKLVQDLVYPGSFVFLRNPKSDPFYDTPISIMDVDLDENLIKIAIDIKGTKTKSISYLNKSEKIMVKGPFWNGVFGLKKINEMKDQNCILVLRGIGQAPSIPVLKKLYSNGNTIITIVDKSPYKKNFISEYLNMYSSETIECKTLMNGELYPPFHEMVTELIETKNIQLIHCDGPDILTSKILTMVDGKVNVSCCNNSKMCCGEGVCGSCSLRFKGQVIKKSCKLQTEPKNIFEGRRLI